MQVEEWQLSQSLTSDSQGIRAACVLPAATSSEVDSLRIITGNQGGGLCEFGVPSGSLNPIEYQHNHAISAILSSEEGYVTGCKDGMVRVFGPSHEVKMTLQGHDKPVTSLAWAHVSGTSFLVSGSWDQTAKVWNIQTGALIATLSGHENSVCVAGLPAGSDPALLQIATGSAGVAENNRISGHTIRIWTVHVSTGKATCLHSVANDHEGPIRSVAALPTALVSCSNDGTVKMRSLETGQCTSTLTFMHQQQSHPPMLLSVAPVDGALVATAEDGNVVVWDLESGNGEPQLLLHPSCVWNVVPMPNGDFATCCDDGTLRIFTRSTERVAPEAERQHFAKAVQEAHQKKSSGPTQEEIAKLPLWETAAQHQGTSEGQVQVFNKGGIAIAAQWSAVSRTWIEVGQVMGSSDGGSINGTRYDHVLPIEVDQTGGGVAKLQIGYNNGENPFVAAQRFIDEYQLPQYHLNDIADYIQQRVGNETPTLGGGTGGTTGTVATAGVPMVSYQHLPMPTYQSFDLPTKSATTTLEKMKTKLVEFGKLSESQLADVSSLMETLAATNRYHSSKIKPSELTVISDMLKVFPPAEVFPALDLARMTVLHPDAASNSNSAYWTKVLSQAVSICDPATAASLEGPAAVAIPMLTLRLFANAFRGGPGSVQAAASHLNDMMTCAQAFVMSKNKNVRLSVATVLYNVAFYLHSTSKTNPRPEVASQLVAIGNSVLDAKMYETEALTRTLVALGTVALASPEAKEAAKSLFIVSKVEMAASPHSATAKAVAKEVYNVLQ